MKMNKFFLLSIIIVSSLSIISVDVTPKSFKQEITDNLKDGAKFAARWTIPAVGLAGLVYLTAVKPMQASVVEMNTHLSEVNKSAKMLLEQTEAIGNMVSGATGAVTGVADTAVSYIPSTAACTVAVAGVTSGIWYNVLPFLGGVILRVLPGGNFTV